MQRTLLKGKQLLREIGAEDRREDDFPGFPISNVKMTTYAQINKSPEGSQS